MGISLDGLTKFASPVGQSLLANAGVEIPALLIGGAVIGAVAAGVYLYEKIDKYEKEKCEARIKEVNEIYSTYLKQMITPQYGALPGFPPIFQLMKDNTYDSLHYTKQQIADIGKLLPTGDVALVSYRESIRAALRKLKDYYFSCIDEKQTCETELNLCVIAYLLQMIDSKCYNFLGYEYDITCLTALTKFITAYASRGRAEYTQHFDRLKDVYSHLLEAQQKLKRHKEVLSLDDTVSGLRDHCVQNSDLLIRTLVKMVVPEEVTSMAENVNHDELIAGVLRNRYIHTEILGFDIKDDKEIPIPESIFKDWIKTLSSYYLDSLNIETKHDISVNIHYLTFFKKAMLVLKKEAASEKLDKAGKEQRDEVKKQIKLMSSVFKNSDNFISSEYRESDKKFHVVEDSVQILNRAKIIAHFAKLIDDVISLQYICIHLSKSIKELGDIYVKDPLHFHKIFSAIDRLCVLIQKDAKVCDDDFTNLQIQNKNKMQRAKKELFPLDTKYLMESLTEGIERLGQNVKNSRRRAKNSLNAATVESANYEMLEVAQAVLKRYFKNIEPLDKNDLDPVPEMPNDDEELYPALNDPGRKQLKFAAKISDIPKIDPVAELKTTLEDVHESILAITDNENTKNYFKIYYALQILQKKSLELNNEPNKSAERIEKADKILKLALSLSKKVAVFLSKTYAQRQETVIIFSEDVHNMLDNEDISPIIDSHRDSMPRFAYAHLGHLSFFRTDTRKKLNDLDIACAQLNIT